MSSPFSVVVPTVLTDATFISSSIPEDDYAVYAGGTTYATGDRVIITTGVHKIYESLVDSNTGNNPPDFPLKWVEVGPTNRWAMFDESGGTVSTYGSPPLEVSFTGDRIDSFVLLDVNADTVTIEASSVIEGGYYNQTFDLSDGGILQDWYEYFFTAVEFSTELSVFDIPPITGSTYTVRFTGGSGVSVGTLVFGRNNSFGFTQYGAKAGIRNYGATRVDDFGKVTFVRRGFAKTMDVQIFMDKALADTAYKTLANLRDSAAVYIAASDSFGMLTIYGRYTDFSIDIAYPQAVICSLQVEGLV